MPDSASGVSMTRSSPKSFWRFSVTRNTPPSLPMSSPMMTTLGSRSMARRRPALMALPMPTFDMSVASLEARGVCGERGAFGLDQRVLIDIDVVKHRPRLWVRHRQAALANRDRERVAQLPDLDLGGDAVLRRVVGGRVRTHAVGVGLDHHRPLPAAGRVHRGLRHGVHGEDVVAVHPDAWEAEPTGPLVDRDPALSLGGLGDCPLVVLAEEDDRRVHGRRVDERLVDVALSGRTITEVG